MDTLGPAILSFIERLASLRRLKRTSIIWKETQESPLQRSFSISSFIQRSYKLYTTQAQLQGEVYIITRKLRLNWKWQGNWSNSWWTQSSHWRKTGLRWLGSGQAACCPQRSLNRWPNPSHSLSTSTWNPCSGPRVKPSPPPPTTTTTHPSMMQCRDLGIMGTF